MSAIFDTSLTDQLRDRLHVKGLVPPAVESYDIQTKRCLKQIVEKSTAIDKYVYLSHLRNTNYNLFYRVLIENIKMITPLVYTPVVGEACLRWSDIFSEPEGLYLSWEDRGNLRQVIANWPEKEVDITVVTDGSRILGLGDLGVNGMGIAVGKLSLYSAASGIHPKKTLPITIDLGTDNAEYLNDDLYLGLKMKRLGENEMMSFLDEMMAALKARWPGIVIQFEDFKNPFPSLQKYQNMYTCFNDDIQGTGAVILAGVMNALKHSGVPTIAQKVVFMGAGSAGVGVAAQIMELFIKEGGLTQEEARKQFWLVDTKGLVTNDRGDKLAEHKKLFSRSDNDKQYKTLEEVVDYVRPTILMGLSTIGGMFNESIIRKMAECNPHPIIFPLSNPSDKSECTYEEAMKWTNDTAVFASGSPFPAYISEDGRVHEPGQGNNMYVFPGIGLGTIVARASLVNQDMIYASAESLASSLNEDEIEKGWLYPDLRRIREVSVIVARGVIRSAERSGLVRNKEINGMNDDQLDVYIRSKMYNPHTSLGQSSNSEPGMWSWLKTWTSNPKL